MSINIKEELESIFLNELDPVGLAAMGVGMAAGYGAGKLTLRMVCKRRYGEGSEDYKECIKKGILGKKMADRKRNQQRR